MLVLKKWDRSVYLNCMIQNDVRIIIPNMGEKKTKLIGDTLDGILKK